MSKLLGNDKVYIRTRDTTSGLVEMVNLDITTLGMYCENLSLAVAPLMDAELCLEAYQACDELDGDALTEEALRILSSLLGSPVSLFDGVAFSCESGDPRLEKKEDNIGATLATTGAALVSYKRKAIMNNSGAIRRAGKKVIISMGKGIGKTAVKTANYAVDKFPHIFKGVFKHLVLVTAALSSLVVAWEAFHARQAKLHLSLLEDITEARLSGRIRNESTTLDANVVATRRLLSNTSIDQFYSDRSAFLLGIQKLALSLDKSVITELYTLTGTSLSDKINRLFYEPIDGLLNSPTQRFPDTTIYMTKNWSIKTGPILTPMMHFASVALWKPLNNYDGVTLELPNNNHLIYTKITTIPISTDDTKVDMLSIDEMEDILTKMDFIKGRDSDKLTTAMEKLASDIKKVSDTLPTTLIEVSKVDTKLMRIILNDWISFITEMVIGSHKEAMRGNSVLLTACSTSMDSLSK